MDHNVKTKAIFYGAVCLLLSSCSGGWTDEDKRNYKASCMEEAMRLTDGQHAGQYCDCSLEKLMDKYPAFNDMLENMEKVLTDPDLQRCKEEAGIAVKE